MQSVESRSNWFFSQLRNSLSSIPSRIDVPNSTLMAETDAPRRVKKAKSAGKTR